MAKNTETTTKFRVDISELKSSLQEANRSIALTNSRFKESTAGMEDWTKSADGLSAKITQLKGVNQNYQKILTGVKAEYDKVVAAEGENSKGAQDLEIKMNSLKAAIKGNEAALGKYEEQLSNLDNESDDAKKGLEKTAKAIKETGDSANDASGKLKGFLGGLGKAAIAGVGAAVSGLTASFFASAEATREYREDLGKLQTAYTSAGHDAETATEMYKSFFSVLGEEDRSVEAVSHLAKLTTNQEELSKWTDICAGVWGTYGDSLPIEGLTEAANETAKVGKVTGPLADALNWAGISEDEFNEKLAACNSEQERATLITNTLSAEYANAAETYKELNGDIMDAQRAQSELTDAMAGVGAVAEPVMTSLKLIGAALLNSLLPGIEKLGQSFTDLMKGVDGAGESLGESFSGLTMDILNKISEALPQVANVAVGLVQGLSTGILNALPQLADVAVQVVMTLIEGLTQMTPGLLSGVLDALYLVIDTIVLAIPDMLDAAIEFFTTLVKALPEIVGDLVDQIDTLVADIMYGLLDAIPDLLDAALEFFGVLVDAIPQIIESVLAVLPSLITSISDFLVGAIPQLVSAAIELFMIIVKAIPTIIPPLIEALPTIISAIVNLLVTNLPIIMNAAITLLMAIVNAIPQIIVPLVEMLPSIISTIVNVLISNIPLLLETAITLLMAIVQAIPTIIGELIQMVPTIVTTIIDSLTPLIGDLGSLLGQAFDKFVEWGKDVIKNGKESASKFLDKVVEFIKKLPYDIGKWLTTALLTVGEWVVDFVNKAKEAGKNFIDGVIQFVKDIPSNIAKFLTDTLPKVVSWGVDLAKKGAQAARDLFDSIVNKIKELPGEMLEIGGDLVEGLWNGINNMSNWVSEKIQGFSDGVLDGIKDFFGIHSPSRVMKDQIGKFLPMGLAEGIKSKAQTAVSAMRDMSEKILAPAQNIKSALSETDSGSGGIASKQPTKTVVNNFTQNNYSPKALTRTEIYRQTKNQLAFAGGGR